MTGALGGALIGGAIGNQMDYQNQEIYWQEQQIDRMRPYGYYDDYNPPPRYYNSPGYHNPPGYYKPPGYYDPPADYNSPY